MYKILLLTVLAMCSVQLTGQGIEFFEGTWEEAKAKAKAEDKIIFVDAYASWCGPCKRMAKNVFTQPKVGTFHNNNFINLKLDMEKRQSDDFKRAGFGVSAYPTLFYIDYTGELLQRAVGGQDVNGLIDLGKDALKKVDRTAQYEKLYEDGDRNPELVYNYIKALNQASKSSAKVANSYLRGKKAFKDSFDLKIIFEATQAVDSKAFELLVENKSAIENVVGADRVEAKIIAACQTTAARAIEFEYLELIATASEQLEKLSKEKAEKFKGESTINYAFEFRDKDLFTQTAANYTKKVINKDAQALIGLSKKAIVTFEDDKDILNLGVGWAKQATKADDGVETMLYYAQVLDKAGKKKEALKVAKKAQKKVGENNKLLQQKVKALIQRIEG